MRLYDYFINNKDLINHLESIAINKGYSFFKYKDNINLNINLGVLEVMIKILLNLMMFV